MPTSLQAARRRLGSVLGPFYTATTSTTSTASDSLSFDALADAEADANKFAAMYAMPVSSGSNAAYEVRRIRKDGFTAATGVMRAVAAYSTSLSSGVVVDICSPLPPRDSDGRTGLHTIINRALAECWDIDSLSISPSTASQSTYSLATAADWIRTDEQIVDVWYRRSGSTCDELVPEWRFNHNVDTPEIEVRGVSLSTSDELRPMVYRPLNRWIEVNSTWGTSTAGLSTESDRCLLSEEGIEVVGKAHALAELSKMGDFEGRRVDRADAEAARKDADLWKRRNLPRKFGRPVHWNRATTKSGAYWPREGSLG